MDSSRRNALIWIVGGIALVAAMAAAGAAAALIPGDGGGSTTATASIDLSGLGKMPADTRAAYEAAPSHRDLFAHLPCFCGCSKLNEPHGSLDRCFLLPDGKAEAHASNCKVCTDIATQALAMDAQGLDHATVRARVDAQFARVGPPTDTPKP